MQPRWKKRTVFWDAVQCSLSETERFFKGAYCFHDQGDVQWSLPTMARERVLQRKVVKSSN